MYGRVETTVVRGEGNELAKDVVVGCQLCRAVVDQVEPNLQDLFRASVGVIVELPPFSKNNQSVVRKFSRTDSSINAYAQKPVNK